MATERTLTRLAQDAEDVASGLHTFRDGLPRSATKITAIIAQLFAISALLRGISDPVYPSLSRIEDDLALVSPTLRRSLDGAFDMFARSKSRPLQLAWEDLCDRLERDEGIGMLERLKWYHDFLKAQEDVLLGYRSRELGFQRRQLVSLLDQQELLDSQAQRRAIDASAATTPRPPRPRMPRTETPTSPTIPLGGWHDPFRRASMPPPSVPDPPHPTSPTFTSSSSQTLNSSQTSYSSDTGFVPVQTTLTHWAENVFDGQNPTHAFSSSYQITDPSTCHGRAEDNVLHDLVQDGFIRVIQLSFDRERVWVRLYWRPRDSRARILIMTKDSHGRQLHYCTLLTSLKVIRDNSMLQLCRLRRDGTFDPWATLNFILHERMVLFYSTFVAMKRQDSKPVAHDALLDKCELDGMPRGSQEELLYASTVQDEGMVHKLRLYHDQGSSVLRLEASAFRGPMENVPLWIAFVTSYADKGDVDWAHYEGKGIVSLAALKPPPYVFLSGYQPPQDRDGMYILQFTSDKDAREFVEQWTSLCR